MPCVYVDHLTDAQKKAYILADNRMAMDAGWDEELLAVEMQELPDLGYDLAMTGFDEKKLADLFSDNIDSEAKDDYFDLTAALEKAFFVELGDVWTVGRHRLMCGDATSPDDVNTLMGDTKANLILTVIWIPFSVSTLGLQHRSTQTSALDRMVALIALF